jgi:hypothetical protein
MDTDSLLREMAFHQERKEVQQWWKEVMTEKPPVEEDDFDDRPTLDYDWRIL